METTPVLLSVCPGVRDCDWTVCRIVIKHRVGAVCHWCWVRTRFVNTDAITVMLNEGRKWIATCHVHTYCLIRVTISTEDLDVRAWSIFCMSWSSVQYKASLLNDVNETVFSFNSVFLSAIQRSTQKIPTVHYWQIVSCANVGAVEAILHLRPQMNFCEYCAHLLSILVWILYGSENDCRTLVIFV
jgi:hypothetical protein